MQKIQLHGFNNLTKSLSLCIYDVCYAEKESDKKAYIRYINNQYNAHRLSQILTETCNIIGANILNVSQQDYEPQGASVTILMSEEPLTSEKSATSSSATLVSSMAAHLDKSHICVHTYPEKHPKQSVCTFRADVEISTCGLISPLNALNYLLGKFEADIVTLDYRVRGFTRDVDGNKLYIDHPMASIQQYMDHEIIERYTMTDVNVVNENIFHTKMMLKAFDLQHFLFDAIVDDFSKEEQEKMIKIITQEMQEIYLGRNLYATR